MSTRRGYQPDRLAGFLAELNRRHGITDTDPRTGVSTLTTPRPVPRDPPPIGAASSALSKQHTSEHHPSNPQKETRP